jgi:hypothetical protein
LIRLRSRWNDTAGMMEGSGWLVPHGVILSASAKDLCLAARLFE